MDKRNSKKSEQTERKPEKKDKVDMLKAKKAVMKLETDTSDAMVLPDRGDKKAEKLLKKTAENTNDAKLPPDRGDLKKPTKRVVEIVPKIIADRGELGKTEKQTKKAVDLENNEPKPSSDTEDVDRKTKTKLNVIIKTEEKVKRLEHCSSKENVKKIFTDIIRTVPAENRIIKEKYTLKPKNSPAAVPNVCKKDDQQDRLPKKSNETKENNNDSKQSVTIINFLKPEKKESVQRKPIIRTISSKNDHSKIYKAVTFVDQKKNKPTVLIKIPHEFKNPKYLKSNETVLVKKVKSKISGISVKEKKKYDGKKKKKASRLVASPDVSLRVKSPPTEVAKWAPSSINRHTKPYYEAWVSTTLAAISKNSKKDKLFLEKQNFLQTFQRKLAERPETPELVYENNDERYTGKIKVKHR